MKIALVGYGSMNRAVHAQAVLAGFEVVSIISPDTKEATAQDITSATLNGATVAIECSVPTAAVDNCKSLLQCGVPTVVGTTGWLDRLPELQTFCRELNGCLLWSTNFSIGVNLYFKIVEHAASLFAKFSEYDIWGNELHHRKKADAPSGTAKTLEDIILRTIPRMQSVKEECLHEKLPANAFHFSSTRGGFANFEHTIGFDSAADCVTIKHAARNREGYAVGALHAAEWLMGKQGMFSMQDFIEEKIS